VIGNFQSIFNVILTDIS